MYGPNLKSEVVQVWFLLFPLKIYMKQKVPSYVFLMLDPRCKAFYFVFSFINHEQVKLVVEEYDRIFLFLMFMKCHYHLHVFGKFERGVVDQRVGKGNILDIFEMIASRSESLQQN
jgi:hypothetical protein